MDIKETSLFQQAMQTVRQHNMLITGDRLTVGVSGGADSVALLTFLLSVAAEYQLTLQVCHINHGLRGSESDGDADFVRKLAAVHGLQYSECILQAEKEAKKAGVGIEEYSRNRRYAFFAQTAGVGQKEFVVFHTPGITSFVHCATVHENRLKSFWRLQDRIIGQTAPIKPIIIAATILDTMLFQDCRS